MKKIYLLTLCVVALCSCHPSADNYFGQAALNCNTFSRFGSYEIKEFLMGTPQIYDTDKKEMLAATYQEYFKYRLLDNAVENYQKVKNLPLTNDTRLMITASLQLHEFCVSKYQGEYMQIAKMKDDKQSQAAIDAALKNFDEKYLKEFAEKYDKAWSEGILYAKANGIEVRTVNSSPTLK